MTQFSVASMPARLRVPSGTGGFDYQTAFGGNPWTDAARKIAKLVADRSSSQGISWQTQIARPEDKAVQDYMGHILGGQRSMLDDYVRRAAGAGITRGGLNVRGGPAFDSALHQTAMGALAKGYADRFREAMNYNKYARATAYEQYKDSISNLQNLLSLQHRYLSSEADWQSRVGNLMHDDWRQNLEWERQQPFRQMELDRMKRQAEVERWRNAYERMDRVTARTKQAEQDQRWRNLMSRSSDFGRPWSPAEVLEAERALVEMGTWKPLARSVTMSIRGGK